MYALKKSNVRSRFKHLLSRFKHLPRPTNPLGPLRDRETQRTFKCLVKCYASCKTFKADSSTIPTLKFMCVQHTDIKEMHKKKEGLNSQHAICVAQIFRTSTSPITILIVYTHGSKKEKMQNPDHGIQITQKKEVKMQIRERR